MLFFESGRALAEPGLDLGLVALRRPDLWLLNTLTEGGQEAIDVRRVIADPAGALDRRGDPRRAPDIATEAEGVQRRFDRSDLNALRLENLPFLLVSRQRKDDGEQFAQMRPPINFCLTHH